MDKGTAELVAEARASRAGADRVVGPEHDVVGEQLRAAVEELGEGLLAVLGVELVLLLDRDPGEIEALSLDLLVSLCLLGLELGELVPGRLPFLAGSDLVFRHLISLQSDSSVPREPNPSSDRTLPGSDVETSQGSVRRLEPSATARSGGSTWACAGGRQRPTGPHQGLVPVGRTPRRTKSVGAPAPAATARRTRPMPSACQRSERPMTSSRASRA